MDTYLSFRRQVALKRVFLKSLKNSLKEVKILVAIVGFLANNEGHVKSSDGSLVHPVVHGIFPQVILLRKEIDPVHMEEKDKLLLTAVHNCSFHSQSL